MTFKPSDLLGAKLATKGGEQADTDAALAGVKYLALYFSAHWCPPCRRFTPMLGAYYQKHAAAKEFEVVFVSSDNSEAEFNEYFASHSWRYAVPFGAKDVIGKLSRTYRVRGIPTLVIVDAATGATVTTEAVQEVAGDEAASGFPYRQKGVWELLEEAGTVVDKAGVATSVADLRAGADVIGLYFSAHWCGPCRGFTPQLAKWYTDRLAAAAAAAASASAHKLDIVFVSSDRDEGSFQSYLQEMPWKALPFAARGVKAGLSSLFNVEGIPTLVFVSSRDGSVITTNGREKVSSDPEGFPWPPTPVDTLANATDYINDLPVAILFTDTVTDSDNEAAAVAAFTAVAEEAFAAAGGKPSDDIRFAIAREGDEAIETVRRFLGIMKDKDGATAARLVVINVPEASKANFNGGALGIPTADDVRSFIAAFAAGKAPLVPIKA